MEYVYLLMSFAFFISLVFLLSLRNGNDIMETEIRLPKNTINVLALLSLIAFAVSFWMYIRYVLIITNKGEMVDSQSVTTTQMFYAPKEQRMKGDFSRDRERILKTFESKGNEMKQ